MKQNIISRQIEEEKRIRELVAERDSVSREIGDAQSKIEHAKLQVRDIDEQKQRRSQELTALQENIDRATHSLQVYDEEIQQKQAQVVSLKQSIKEMESRQGSVSAMSQAAISNFAQVENTIEETKVRLEGEIQKVEEKKRVVLEELEKVELNLKERVQEYNSVEAKMDEKLEVLRLKEDEIERKTYNASRKIETAKQMEKKILEMRQVSTS